MKSRYCAYVIIMAVSLVSCSKIPPAGKIQNALVVPAALQKFWYAQRLEAQGFFVLPEPLALPPFSVKALSGQQLDSSSLTGKITVLNFWATWCPPCKEEMPSMEAASKALKDEKFGIVAISVNETRKTVEAFIKKSGYTFPIYLDESGEVSSGFVTRGIPTTLIVDKDGMVIASIIGSTSYDTPEMIAILRELSQR